MLCSKKVLVVVVYGRIIKVVNAFWIFDVDVVGPDLLTLTIGSDIARCPNTPRPACRGYLHKRTQSGLIKSWRKRWFVLSHECCLYYYKHKRVSTHHHVFKYLRTIAPSK